MTVIDRIRHFRDDCRGVAASEFALILPVLILLLFGTAEIGNALLLDKKVTSAAQTAADLVAQQKSVSSADITNIFTAMDTILAPYSASVATYTIASVVADEDGVVTIDWQKHQGTTLDVEEFDVPDGLLSTDDSVIIAVISYTYSPLFADLITGSFTISDTAYLRPRTTTNVEFTS